MRNFLTFFALFLIFLTTCAGLKCYVCDKPCEVGQAKTSIMCGDKLSDNTEAFCLTEFIKGEENSQKAVRKCSIVLKGQEPVCKGIKCDKCKTDLCNKGPETKPNTAPSLAFGMLANLAAFLFVKFL